MNQLNIKKFLRNTAGKKIIFFSAALILPPSYFFYLLKKEEQEIKNIKNGGYWYYDKDGDICIF
uniref:Uncharacterized protein n=1 Tax=viral metagenome TaxID=1070528 RepID=A0A6C0AD41_9ZZZZ